MSGERNGAALSFTGLTVRYGKTTAVDGVSLSVNRGEVYALLGRNGSGKTSMIRCLLGQMMPCAGSAELLGRDAWEGRAASVAGVGVVPETPDMPPTLKAGEIAAFCSRLYPSWDGKGVAARMKRFGVPDGVPFARLSRGQKNQLALALALAPMPDLLILDDPTLGLDAVARKEFFEELVGDLADRGTTVFISTHDLSGIEGIASHAGILKHGRLLVNEEMEALKARFRAVRWTGDFDPIRLDALAPVMAKREAWGGEAVVSAYSESSFALMAQEAAPIQLEASPVSLEECFIALAGEEGGAR